MKLQSRLYDQQSRAIGRLAGASPASVAIASTEYTGVPVLFQEEQFDSDRTIQLRPATIYLWIHKDKLAAQPAISTRITWDAQEWFIDSVSGPTDTYAGWFIRAIRQG